MRRSASTVAFGALLLALSLLIPLAFGGFLGIHIGPGSATLASHVPTFLAMLYGPGIAGIVAAGSALGFFIKLGPVIGARAAMHIGVGVTGALLLRKGFSFPVVLASLAPVHAFLESLVVLLLGFSLRQAGILVGAITLAHHCLDALIAVAVWRLAFKPHTRS